MGDLVAWRLQKPRYGAAATDLLSGEGALRAGGRWNSRGRRVVCLSSSLALAILEMLAQARKAAILPYYLKLSVRIPEALIYELAPADWLPGWDDPTLHPPGAQQLGDTWVDLKQSAALRVPSAVVPEEWNVLLNPAHPDFKRIEVGAVTRYRVDPRIAHDLGN